MIPSTQFQTRRDREKAMGNANLSRFFKLCSNVFYGWVSFFFSHLGGRIVINSREMIMACAEVVTNRLGGKVITRTTQHKKILFFFLPSPHLFFCGGVFTGDPGRHGLHYGDGN
jgi:hypothetical protein